VFVLSKHRIQHLGQQSVIASIQSLQEYTKQTQADVHGKGGQFGQKGLHAGHFHSDEDLTQL